MAVLRHPRPGLPYAQANRFENCQENSVKICPHIRHILLKLCIEIYNKKKALGTRATNVVVVASLVVLAPHQAVPSKSATSVNSFTSAKCIAGIAGIAACTVHALGGTTWPGFLIKRPNNSCRFAESTCSPVRRSTEFSRPCRSCHSFHSQNSPDHTNLAAIHLFAHVNISPDFNLKI